MVSRMTTTIATILFPQHINDIVTYTFRARTAVERKVMTVDRAVDVDVLGWEPLKQANIRKQYIHFLIPAAMIASRQRVVSGIVSYPCQYYIIYVLYTWNW